MAEEGKRKLGLWGKWLHPDIHVCLSFMGRYGKCDNIEKNDSTHKRRSMRKCDDLFFDILISFHVFLSCLYSFTRFQSFLRSLHTWQVEGLGVGWRLNTNRAGEQSFTALPVSGLKAHGRSAGALGNHIDLALTDTCREREVWATGEERSPIPSAVSSSAPHSPLQHPPPHPPPSPSVWTGNICCSAPFHNPISTLTHTHTLTHTPLRRSQIEYLPLSHTVQPEQIWSPHHKQTVLTWPQLQPLGLIIQCKQAWTPLTTHHLWLMCKQLLTGPSYSNFP